MLIAHSRLDSRRPTALDEGDETDTSEGDGMDGLI
jgi:hypothetical protein